MPESILDAAQIGKMFVTSVTFTWQEAGQTYNEKTRQYDKNPGHWNIHTTLSEKPARYGNTQSMCFNVEHGIGQKLVECLLPVIIADASRKADQLATDSKAMLSALGERTLTCIANMPSET
jgi:hypothetical protein